MKEKILIALNDSTLQDLLFSSLKKVGYSVENIKSGKDVIDRLKKSKADLLLLDTVLAGKNGYDILKDKADDKSISNIPVIIVSNSGSPLQMNQIPSTPSIKEFIVRFHIEPDEVLEKIEKIFRGESINKDNKVNSMTNGKKILWAEDDKLLSTILSNKIKQSNYILLKASNGDDVFKILENEVPDIIVLDILLPEINGLDILQKIKTNEKLRKIPTIMLSNLSKQGDIDRAKLLGANKFIVKAAVSLDEILREIGLLIPNK
jgi:CheY-like chemotaxis protein